MRLLVHAARRSGVGMVLAGFVAGIILTITALSVVRDGGGVHVMRQLDQDDAQLRHQQHHHHHQHHQHQHGDEVAGGSDNVKVVDLSEQDRHKHAGHSLYMLCDLLNLLEFRGSYRIISSWYTGR